MALESSDAMFAMVFAFFQTLVRDVVTAGFDFSGLTSVQKVLSEQHLSTLRLQISSLESLETKIK